MMALNLWQMQKTTKVNHCRMFGEEIKQKQQNTTIESTNFQVIDTLGAT